MTAKALCVGINKFAHLPRASWLNGCVNDAEDMAAMLRKRPAFRRGGVTVLKDGQATKVKVMAALKKLIDDADVDHVDEAFACFDLKQRGRDWDRKTVIVDDELKALFETVGKDVLVEVVLDTCNSGTGLKSLDLLPGRRPRFIPPPTPLGIRRLERKSDPKGLQDEVKKIPAATRPVLFAACRADQVASDAPFGVRYNGAFTYYLLKALRGSAKTRADVLKAVGKSLADEEFSQVPQLEAVPKAKTVPFGTRWS